MARTTAQIRREWNEEMLREQKRQHRHNRKIRRMRMKKAKAENKISGRFMNRIVIADILAALIFTIVMIVVFVKTGSEPSTLIQNVFQYAINKNYLNIFIPDTRINQKNKFLKEFRNFLKFQDSLSGTHRSVSKKRINTIIYTGHKKIFNYTVGKNISDSISTDPIIVLDNGVLSDNFYFSTATQGMVQFGDLKELQNNLKKFSLEPYITGITNAKSRLSEFNVNMSRQIFLIILITLISISQLILVIIFISLSFLQRKRLKMTINKIFGQSNRKLIFNFCFFNIGSDGLVIFILIALEQQRWQMGLTMFPYLIVEFFVVIILAKIAQRNLLTTLNSGN